MLRVPQERILAAIIILAKKLHRFPPTVVVRIADKLVSHAGLVEDAPTDALRQLV